VEILREMQEIARRTAVWRLSSMSLCEFLNEAILLIRQTPVPFIAAVNGVASGGGMQSRVSL
jgi:enoyl-CoA hydratase/carnithine racemase